MNKLQLAKYVGLGALCFFVGVGAGASGQDQPQTAAQPKVETHTVFQTKTVYKTPAACKSALDTDNKIFTHTADALNTFEFEPLTKYINSVTDQRTADYASCISS